MQQEVLHNRLSKEELQRQLDQEDFERKTVSFYRYVRIEDPHYLRNDLYRRWSDMKILGRVYLASEGINAQISVPEPQWDSFVTDLNSFKPFVDMPFKIGLRQQKDSFLKLIIRVKKQIVADGLPSEEYDIENVGKHLDAEEFHCALEDPETLVVDMRNNYESEIGHFEGALCPDVETFREELPWVRKKLQGKEKKKILLYCTGGIRCEKASAYLRHHGFEDVNQLHGGIIAYAHQVQKKGLRPRFRGKNFVFDERLAEQITDDVLSECHQCNIPCDTHVNCRNVVCNLLFLQCEKCSEQHGGCCSEKCQNRIQLPEEKQKKAEKKNFYSGKGAVNSRCKLPVS